MPISKTKFRENVPLAEHSHYRIGGPAKFFHEPRTLSELKRVLREARGRKLPIFILGGGTNMLFRDEGFAGMVVKPRLKFLKRKGKSVIAGASTGMDELLRFAAREKLSGLEWAGGLPGTVGGAVRGNAGCFGGEIKDSLLWVKTLDLKTLEVRTRSNKECRFAYRASVFKEKGREVVLEAAFRLEPGDAKAIKKAVAEKIAYRKAKQPLEFPSIGSIFKNVPVEKLKKAHRTRFAAAVKTDPMPVMPAALLLSEAKLKGKRKGGALISEKHPNFIVNAGEARATDVEELIALAKKEVKRKFGVDLEEEIMRL